VTWVPAFAGMTAVDRESVSTEGLPASGSSVRQKPVHGDIVRFHRYPACVLLGASQELESAADAAYCREAGIDIARRVTGGGAVYMSPGMLAWDVLVDRAGSGGDLAAVTERVCGGVATGLSQLGVAARFRAPNDIAIGGRKVSGSAGYTAGRVAVLQGTVLIADDVPVMARALRLPEAALRKHVTCLEAEIGATPALQAVMECITIGLAEALDREPVPAQPRGDEIALCEDLLREEIGTDAFVAGRAAAPA
jgi:lipoate-protein ligase A